MPEPTSATTLQRPDLGAIAYEYMLEASQRGFIGLSLLPVFPVSLKTSDYPVIPIEALIKTQSTKRAPRSNYARNDYQFETGTYNCEDHGLEEPVDDTERALYQRFFDLEEVSVKRLMDAVLRGQELRIATLLFNTGNFAYTAIATEWSTAATATPRANVEAGKTAMRAASGLMPNVVAMSLKVFTNLLLTAEIGTAFRYTSPIEIGGVEAQKRLMAQYFGVDRILVGDAIRDTAKKGQTKVLGDIWDDEYVGLFKISAGGNDLREPCVGRSFLWTADSPGNLITEQYRDEPKRCDIYRVRHNIDEALVFAGAGYILSNITA